MNNRIFRLLSVSSDAKTVKGEKYGYLTGILYMAPSDVSGVMNVCPHASPGCRLACLNSAGNGRFPVVQKGRAKRTIWFHDDRAGFLAQLVTEIKILAALAEAQGFTPVVRLNGTSDLPYENFGVIEQFPSIQFYDYTKDKGRFARYLNGQFPANYHLTFSRSETNGEHAAAFVKAGGNVAVVFGGKQLPATYLGAPVVNGDDSDLRFLDPAGSVVGLLAKNKAKTDKSGFTVNL